MIQQAKRIKDLKCRLSEIVKKNDSVIRKKVVNNTVGVMEILQDREELHELKFKIIEKNLRE